MEIEQVSLSPADTGRIRGCFEVMLAAERVDHPGEPLFTEQPFTGWMTVGWDGSAREVWLATDQGQAVGWCRLDLPAKENLDQGGLEIVVHPAARQRGIGRALLRHAAGRAAGHGRTVLNGGARDGSPGEAFARAAGAKPGLVAMPGT
jgi:GNAT superfamily N-acetyltransferase